MPLWVLPFCVMRLCVLPFCVLPFFVLPFCVMSLCVMPLCVMPVCVLALCVLPFSAMPFSAWYLYDSGFFSISSSYRGLSFTNFDSVYFRFDLTLFTFRLLNFVIDIPSYNVSPQKKWQNTDTAILIFVLRFKWCKKLLGKGKTSASDIIFFILTQRMLLPQQFSTQQIQITNLLVSAHKSRCKQVSHDPIYVSVLKSNSL